MNTDSSAPVIVDGVPRALDDRSNGEISTRGRTRAINLPSAQWELIELCVRVTQMLGIPRSEGEIFGFVFSSPTPVTFDEVVQALGISNGSASHGLRHLRRLGAIKATYFARDRRDYFQAETSLQKLVNGYLAETVVHKLSGMADRLHALHAHLAESSDVESASLSDRVGLLLKWNARAGIAVSAALSALD